MQLYKPKWILISVLFSLVGSWSVSSRHHESCSQLCEEGEGANSSLPGLGFAFCGREVWVSSLPSKSPWNHKSSSSPKGLCPQVSMWKVWGRNGNPCSLYNFCNVGSNSCIKIKSASVRLITQKWDEERCLKNSNSLWLCGSFPGGRSLCRLMPQSSPALVCWHEPWDPVSSRTSKSFWNLCWLWAWGKINLLCC